MRESRDEGVKGLRKVRADRSNLQKMRGGVWIGAKKGFSLIELIGVMAVMGILASMTVPPILRQIRQAQTVNEDANLNEVARAIVEGIKATGTIPNPNVAATDTTSWVSIAGPYTTLSEKALQYVFPDNPSTERRYCLDPDFVTYLAGTYTTPPDGFPVAGFPVGALRILIVSSSRGILNPPDPLSDPVLPGNAGVNLTQADQLALRNWNKVFSGGVVSVPLLPDQPFSSALWKGIGEYLHVKTVDLRPLFCRVDLVEYPLPQNASITTTPGAGYSGDTSYNGTTAAGFVFAFTTPGPPATTVSYVNPTAGIYISGKGMINRVVGISVNDPGTVPIPGGISANFNSTVSSVAPYPPWWEISPPSPVVSQQMPSDANTKAFYVLKGTSLSLYAEGVTRPASPILTLQINADCSFEYFNGSWIQRN